MSDSIVAQTARPPLVSSPLAFVRKAVWRLLHEMASPSDASHFDDLVQIGLIAVWEKNGAIDSAGRQFPISYLWKCVTGRCRTALRRIHRARSGPRPLWAWPHPEALGCDGVEYRDLVETALAYLGRERTEQGVKDQLVFRFWLEGANATGLPEHCPWLSSPESAERALVRIFTALRDRFGGDTMAPVVSRGRRKCSQAGPRKHDRADYQRSYYEAHRSERIAAAGAAKKARAAQAAAVSCPERREALHAALRALGYVRYGLADSGASAYYVHPDGFRARVSDHDAQAPDTAARVVAGQMVLVRIDHVASVEGAVASIEAARAAAKKIG